MQSFLDKHRLPASYAETARHFFNPVAEQCIQLQTDKSAPLLIALNGTQGSGKTTLADYLCYYFGSKGFRCLSLSLDDFYLSKAERVTLSKTIHPLFQTRGVPGTHDIHLLNKTLEALLKGEVGTAIPRFDKAVDDLKPRDSWDMTEETFDFIIFEGWCWGARHQDSHRLQTPVNDLEREEDAEGVWRSYSNEQLAHHYEPIYELMDIWLMLKAPSFDCVLNWRMEQEHKLRASQNEKQGLGIMNDDDVRRFIKFYERITNEILETLPNSADLIWELDAKRNITGIKTNGKRFYV